MLGSENCWNVNFNRSFCTTSIKQTLAHTLKKYIYIEKIVKKSHFDEFYAIQWMVCLHSAVSELCKEWYVKDISVCVCVFTYKDQAVDPRGLLPKLWSLIQLIQLVDPLQHHLVGFTCKGYYALKTHKSQVTSDTLTNAEWSVWNGLKRITKWHLLIAASTGVAIVLHCTFKRMTVMGCPALFLNIFSHSSSWNSGKWVFTLQRAVLC